MASSADPDAATPPSAPQPEPARKAVRVVVKGSVTGVGFRDWTASTAESLGLAGWVRNRRDGSVEALLSGDPAKIEDMITRRLPVGPPAATVTAVVPSGRARGSVHRVRDQVHRLIPPSRDRFASRRAFLDGLFVHYYCESAIKDQRRHLMYRSLFT
uniref:acylphosphatase n=1 Tax=Zea mays TaxID=4577 RepID=B6SJD3_MAIZE|nr:acylphosphatase [Zea mays]